MMNAQDFYCKQSKFSDPKEFSYLYEPLPDSIEEICQIIRGIIIHQDDADKIYGYKIPKARELEPNTRYTSEILKTIVTLQNDPLTIERPPDKRFIGLCRDFALMLCSILRYKGIPARIRCGFATYYESNVYIDHWLCEYWDKQSEEWILVDTEVNDKVRVAYHIKPSLNSYHVSHEEYILSGQAWEMCRTGEANPKSFGVPEIGVIGLWFIAASLVRDLASLNNIELLPWDYTNYTDKQFQDISEISLEDAKLLDETARVIRDLNSEWPQVISHYKKHSNLQILSDVISYRSDGRKTVSLNA